MAKDTPRATAYAIRRTKALRLRVQGHTYKDIARVCGYTTPERCKADLTKELRESVRETADELLELELIRLDALLRPVLKKAKAGDLWAVDRALTIMERRSKFLGLDAAQRPDDYSQFDRWLSGIVDDPEPVIDPEDVLGKPVQDLEDYDELTGDDD